MAHLPLLLIAGCLVLLPFGRSVEVPVLLMAGWGVVLLARRGSELFARPGVRLFTALFLLFWVPLLVSLLGAIEPEESARVTFAMPRFYFAGVFLIVMLRDDDQRERLLRIAAVVLSLWILDALIQAVTGSDLFGYRSPPDRLNGLFGEDQLKLGMTLAACAPLLFDWSWRNWPGWSRFLVLPGTAVVVLLAGSRSGWLALALVISGFLAAVTATRPSLRRRLAVAAIVLAAGIGFVAYQLSPGFASRTQLTARALAGNTEAVDAALSGRLWIWRASARLIADHPLTGVGARGFRYGHAAYADPGDPFIDTSVNEGARYAHLYLLEVLTESGVIGLLGLCGLYVVAIRAWRRAAPERRRAALPFALAVLAALFPLNSNNALYASYWSQLIWYLVALYVAALDGREDRGA